MRVYGRRWKPFASHSRYGRVDWRLVGIDGKLTPTRCGTARIVADNSEWIKTP
jgi:hypothetical protein